ncbi:MAG TPA: NAD-binding protein, partial [Gemmatimonadaceae bacterium]
TSLRHSALSWRERVFVAWIGPRGIVAASVASLFALRLAELGAPDATRLLALTFLTIAMTVTIQGITAPLAARVLSLHATGGKPAIIVGAGPLGLTIARILADAGRPVALIDRNPTYIRRARRAGLETLRGNALEESLLEEAGGDDAELLVAVTTNSEVNALAAQLARDRFGIPHAYTALGQPERGATQEMIALSGAQMAFGRPVDVRQWDAAIESGEMELKWVTLPDSWQSRPVSQVGRSKGALAIARRRGNNVEVTHSTQRWNSGDAIAVVTRMEPEAVIRAFAQVSTSDG